MNNKSLLYTKFDLESSRVKYGEVKYGDIKPDYHSKHLLSAYYEKYPHRRIKEFTSGRGYTQNHWTESIKKILTNNLLKEKGSDYEKIKMEYNKAFIPGISSSLVIKRVNNMIEQLDTKYTLQKNVTRSNFYLCVEHLKYIYENYEQLKPSEIISESLHDLDLELTECICEDVSKLSKWRYQDTFHCTYCIAKLNPNLHFGLKR